MAQRRGAGRGSPRVGVVAIGRNEGARLERCLSSALRDGAPVVYVDSGSTDGSGGLARRLGANVVEVDPAAPFTAARARNEGFAELGRLAPDVELVQLVDGDCELVAGWVARGAAALEADPRLALVCGGVREREPERSVYNLLCDVEWRALAEDGRSCGGNAMVRAEAFRDAGGFRAGLIAGEEADLCLRLRERGWRTARLPDEMVLHDASMLRFGQWWRRSLRSGWSYAEGATLREGSRERPALRENASILFWGVLLPAAALLFAWPTRGASLLLLGGHVALAARIHARSIRAGLPRRAARPYAFFTVLGKLPQAIGQARFVLLRAAGRRRGAMDWRVGA